MADTWPVDNGAVGTQSSTEIGYGEGQVDPSLASAAGIGSTAPAQPTTGPDDGSRGGQQPTTGPDDGSRGGQQPNAGSTTETRSGTTASSDTIPSRTAIIDPAESTVVLAPDTFLQSLQGSLSQILNGALNNLLSSLPPVMQDLLSATGLTGTLSGLVDQLSTQVGEAIGSLTNALSGAVQHIAGELGNAITQIPGVGPVIEGFGSAVGSLTENLQEGFAGLPADLQGFVSNQIGSVGASIISAPNLNSIIPNTIQDTILREINFPLNPLANLDQLAGAARQMDGAFFSQTGNPIFADLGARAQEAESQLSRLITPQGNGFGFRNIVETGNVNNIRNVVSGSFDSIF